MINGEDFGVVSEMLNSVCRVYGWNGFFTPEFRMTIKPSRTELESMVGQYRFQSDTLHAVIRDQGLVFYREHRADNVFTPMFSDVNHFWIMESGGLRCTFTRDEKNQVKTIDFRRGDDHQYWTRLD